MIVATLPTIPERKQSLLQVLQRILYEETVPVQQVHVWLNGYKEQPIDMPADDRIVYHLRPDNPGPYIRYTVASTLANNDVLVTLDDDMIYPDNYIQHGIADLTRKGENAVVCYGGLRWTPFDEDCDYYHASRLVIPLHVRLAQDKRVAVLMGASGFLRASAAYNVVNIGIPGLPTNDDLMVSYHLQKRGVAVWCCKKSEGWLTCTEDAIKPTALFKNDKGNRRETFRTLVHKWGFDPTAGWLDELRQFPRHIVVLASEIPVRSGDSTLHERIANLRAEVTAVHVLAPVTIPELIELGPLTDLPYLVHPSIVHENEGRFGKFSFVRRWRGRKLETLAQETWDKRLNAILSKLPGAEVVDWRLKHVVPG